MAVSITKVSRMHFAQMHVMNTNFTPSPQKCQRSGVYFQVMKVNRQTRVVDSITLFRKALCSIPSAAVKGIICIIR